MSRSATLLSLACLTLPLMTFAAEPVFAQDVADLIRSARERANSARQQALGIQEQATEMANPFRGDPGTTAADWNTTPQPNGPDLTPQAPGVQISGSEIVISLDGKSLHLPRHGLTSPDLGPSATDPSITGQQPVAALLKMAHAVGNLRKQDFQTAKSQLMEIRSQLPAATVEPLLSLAALMNDDLPLASESAYESARVGAIGNWEQLRDLLGNTGLYQQKYRQLQNRLGPQSPLSLRFLVAWQHTILGHADAAGYQWDMCQQLLPQDPVISRMREWVSSASFTPPMPQSPAR